jgi:hypothetical protein
MREEPEGVRQVRQWRQALNEKWKDKSLDEIVEELGNSRELAHERRQRRREENERKQSA